MRITPLEQRELADAVARAVRLQFRVIQLTPLHAPAPAQQADVALAVREAIEQFCCPTSEDERYAAADERLTAQYEEGAEHA